MLQKIYLKMIGLLPAMLVLGIFDYRFSNYFWPWLDRLRPDARWVGGVPQYFDFFSVLDGFVLVLALIALLTVRKFKWRWFYIVPCLILAGVAFAFLNFEAVEPHIRSFSMSALTLYLLPVILFLSLFGLKDRAVLERSFLAVFLVFALVILLEYFTDFLPGENRDFLNRLVWPYIDPFVDMHAESANWLSYLFGPMIVLSALWRKTWLGKATFVISFLVLLFTKSYTGLLVVLGLLGWMAFLEVPKKMRKWLVVALMVAGILGVASQWNSDKFQILLGNYHKANSIERRVQIYDTTWQAFEERPLVGIGPGNYQSYFRANTQYDIPEIEIPPHPHNLVAMFWSDLGIFGLSAILLIYLAVLWEVFYLKNPRALLIAYPLGHGLVDTPYLLDEVVMLFWILMIMSRMSLISDKVSKAGSLRSKNL